jgi:hypothetical protein
VPQRARITFYNGVDELLAAMRYRSKEEIFAAILTV